MGVEERKKNFALIYFPAKFELFWGGGVEPALSPLELDCFEA
jgi:hypothetical protein